MLNPMTSSVISSAITTTVKICSPIGFRNFPSSASTLATMPRLLMDRIPASASALLKFRPIPKSWIKPVVTSMDMPREKRTDTMAARK